MERALIDEFFGLNESTNANVPFGFFIVKSAVAVADRCVMGGRTDGRAGGRAASDVQMLLLLGGGTRMLSPDCYFVSINDNALLLPLFLSRSVVLAVHYTRKPRLIVTMVVYSQVFSTSTRTLTIA